ncbi:myo-inosose-2 dehydratase [Methylobacterium sp. SyP6R]|uniref:myo-inosose-2 dehydratase n=1 Tax=Methylobacterium sp. SyP6R TaxID=2718876 RepID=UPI001F021CA9|nr:myo-inosose-2 dehydratase [Methylobacterium sp. SyP6R]MCF4129509.1 myo-inosose-2 dehydratase [Methylobacterium sp. SyP6R]
MTAQPPKLKRDKVRIGVTPTLWWNDDFWSIDIGITFGQCVSEMALAGYEGCSVGHKYPKDPCVLKAELDLRGLTVSEPWVSTYFTIPEGHAQTIATVRQQLDFLDAVGGHDLVVAEFGGAANPQPIAVFANRPIFDDRQWKHLCDGLNEIGRMANDRGKRLCYHPHMGTGVNVAADIDRLMHGTAPDLVHLLLDTGHLYFAGVDPLHVANKHGKRIKHIHLKNNRAEIVERARTQNWSFQTAVENGVFTVPGDPDGCIDFPPIFEALARHDFAGWIVVEAEQDPAKANPLRYARMAREYLRATLGF